MFLIETFSVFSRRTCTSLATAAHARPVISSWVKCIKRITSKAIGDMKLDIAKFQPAAPANTLAQGGVGSGSGASGKVHVESIPPGADIEVDGSFVGSTPSDLQLTEGEHTVSVKKTGFKDWGRKLKVSGGSSLLLSAELDKTANP